ncbi:hypothetical protein [Dyadobacter aurulentus]|uniref:hypothetical protein n=1 Tax=Dyadobacter sp. UC 10 TaxID=2605428 RepID=UPI0011F1F871|nr:hypothetical protein [Dyadobacter sp. UC 10]KAA0990879.1 hypothetical protein FXO21_12305 [Dyadobacter sp. UC 10]
MKTILYAILAIFFTACANKEEKVPANQNQEIVIIPSSEDLELFPTLVANDPNYSKRNSRESLVASDLKIASIDREVEGVAPFPTLSKPIKVADQIEALKSYRKMSAHFKADQFINDPIIISTFQASYSKKILFDYNLINSEHYDQIKFLTNELIISKMGDYSTIIASLQKLKNNINEKSFNDLLERTNVQIQQSFEREKATKLMIEKLVIELETKNKLAVSNGASKKAAKEVRMMQFHLATLKNRLKVDRVQLLHKYSQEINAI